MNVWNQVRVDGQGPQKGDVQHHTVYVIHFHVSEFHRPRQTAYSAH